MAAGRRLETGAAPQPFQAPAQGIARPGVPFDGRRHLRSAMPDRLPHADAWIIHDGAEPPDADYALVLLHGRGADADGMLALASALVEGLPGAEAWALVAPEADGRTWYPQRFLAPLDENQPWLDGARALLDRLLGELADAGLDASRVVLGGFSQGACLALDTAARHGAFAGVLAFSGGLIGPPGTAFDVRPMDGTPVLLTVHDADPHIPLVRVEDTARAVAAAGADVTARIYRGSQHTVNADALAHGRALIARAARET